MTLTLAELAARAHETPERLRAWQTLGLLRGADAYGAFDLTKIRLLQYLLRHGLTAEGIAAQLEAMVNDFKTYLDLMHPAGDETVYTLSEAAEQAGLPLEVVSRILESMGLAADDDLFAPEDVAMLRFFATALEVGMAEEAILQLVRVYRDALARVGEAEIRLFHFYVHEPLQQMALTGLALMGESRARSARLIPWIEPALAYFHRRGMAAAAREDLLLHLHAPSVAPGAADLPGQLGAAIVFTDLSSFTPMTEVMGDAYATAVVARFGTIAHEAAGRWAGRVVKQIGDACMLVFFEPGGAVSCALDIVATVAAEPSFPAARAGVHCGPVLYREGDYLGAAVNLAARLVAVAERNEVLVSAAVREHVGELAGVELVARGPRTIKGLVEAQELYQARRTSGAPVVKARDLVCGMELAPSEVAARLALGGEERVFCSEACLRRFVAAPQHYLKG